MVEITSNPHLDLERIVFPPLAKLRHIPATPDKSNDFAA
jgi:hypothetical protein